MAVTARTLVAGVGNIFLGDDGFGPEAIRHLGHHYDGDDGVRVVDYGIGGMHLAYDLLEDWSALIIVDALPDRGSPGSLHVFEADHESLCAEAVLDAHGMDPGAVFASLRARRHLPGHSSSDVEALDTAEGIGLSPPVRAALPAAVRAIRHAVATVREA